MNRQIGRDNAELARKYGIPFKYDRDGGDDMSTLEYQYELLFINFVTISPKISSTLMRSMRTSKKQNVKSRRRSADGFLCGVSQPLIFSCQSSG